MNAAERLLGQEALARHGARVALVCGEEQVSFAELADRVARSAGALASHGVRPGARLLLLMRDTPECAAVWLGAVRAGAVAIALNNRLRDAELHHIVQDCAPQLAIVDERFARPDGLAGVRVMHASAWRDQLRTASAAPAFAVAPETPAFLLYSSGTTGRPKGIVHVHRSFEPLGMAFHATGIGEGDRVFTTSRLFFAYGLEHGLLAPLALGATALLHPDWPDSDAVLQMASRHQPTALFSVPTVYRRLLAEPGERLAPLRAVRRFVVGGERLSPQLVEQWRDAVGGELLNLYGMSETFCACMMTPPGTSNGVRTGLPFAGVAVRLSDPQDGAPSGAGPGVLWVRHPAQASGYHNLPEETRALFRDGWFCTRDLFVRDAQGFFIHQGRSDELLKIAGQWVQPGELEEAAAQAAAVAEAVCVPVPDADGLERLALFVTARGDADEALRAAAAACARALPQHKQPKWLRAVAELPRTATGKVQRFRLREMLERELSGKD